MKSTNVKKFIEFNSLEEGSKGLNIHFKISLVFILAIAFLGYFSFKIQILEGAEFKLRSDSSITTSRQIQPMRGIIKDKNGVVLASNVDKYDLYLKFAEYTDDEINNIVTLEQFKNYDLRNKILDARTNKQDIRLLSNLSAREAYDLETKLKDDDRFYFISGKKRIYKYPEQFAHVIGYTSLISPNQLETDAYYESSDYVGKYKLELDLEEYLRGTKSQEKKIGDITILNEGIPGDDVTLTIDSNWQNYLYDQIKSYAQNTGSPSGAAVIVDIENGDVAALVSYPGFDTNLLINGISQKDYEDLSLQKGNPFQDKAISVASEPGSVFKIVSAYTLLQNKVIDENTTYFSNSCINLGGLDFCEYNKNFYGSMDIKRAIYKSSNLFFCNYLSQMQNEKGIDAFVEAQRLFSIGIPTGIDLSGEVAGNSVSPEKKLETQEEQWYTGDTCNSAIGQGSVLTTPIQMALAIATIANNGEYLKPNLVKKIEKSDGALVQQSSKKVDHIVNLDLSTKQLMESGVK